MRVNSPAQEGKSMKPYIYIVYLIIISLSRAHIALYRPIPRGGFGSEALGGQYSVTVLDFPEDTVYNLPPSTRHSDQPCLRFKKNTPIPVRPGEIYNASFYAGDMRTISALDRENLVMYPSNKQNIKQVRHGGGECRFYLSYDNGITGREVTQYTRTCPDIYYNWPVMIPHDAASCVDCLLVWVWYAYNVPQSYVNCAHINIDSVYDIVESYRPIPIKYPLYKVIGDGQANGPGPQEEELKVVYNMKNALSSGYKSPTQTYSQPTTTAPVSIASSSSRSAHLPRLMRLLGLLNLLW